MPFDKFLIAASILEFIVGGLLLARFHRKFQKQKQKCDLAERSLAENRNSWDIEKRQLTAEIELRQNELSSLSLQYIQKIELVNELRENIEAFKASMPKELAPKLVRLIGSTSAFEKVDKEWENFRTYFNDANFGFFDQLKSQYPTLSSKDLKLCALLRLNLDTKQIATIMGVSPESAKVTRHRIRKKLGLTGSDNLHDFLHKISSLN